MSWNKNPVKSGSGFDFKLIQIIVNTEYLPFGLFIGHINTRNQYLSTELLQSVEVIYFTAS